VAVFVYTERPLADKQVEYIKLSTEFALKHHTRDAVGQVFDGKISEACNTAPWSGVLFPEQMEY